MLCSSKVSGKSPVKIAESYIGVLSSGFFLSPYDCCNDWRNNATKISSLQYKRYQYISLQYMAKRILTKLIWLFGVTCSPDSPGFLRSCQPGNLFLKRGFSVSRLMDVKTCPVHPRTIPPWHTHAAMFYQKGNVSYR